MNVYADDNVQNVQNNQSIAEIDLYSATNITEQDITNRLSQFTKDYLENEKNAKSVIGEMNNNFIQNSIYYDKNIKDKTYEELKKEFNVIPDNSLLTDYKKTYTTYRDADGNLLTENTVFDTPEFTTVLTNSYWKEAYAAYKAYSGYAENDALNSNEFFQKYYEAFLNILKNKNGFYNTSLKAHVDKYYYNESLQTEATKEDFEKYLKEKEKVVEAKKIIDKYEEELKDYEKQYLSHSAYYSYLQQMNISSDNWSYLQYKETVKKGNVLNIPSAPEKPEKYKELTKIINDAPTIETIKLHEKITYTLSETEASQVMSDYESKDKKILKWAFETLNTITGEGKTINATVTDNYNETLKTDYDSRFSEERQKISEELKTILSEKMRLRNTGDLIVSYAKSRIGCRYYWGATGDDMFDCSGLVYWSLNKAGVSVPRLTANLYGNSGTEITSTDDILPGDVISIGKTTNYTHIGIYAGNGEVVEATGEGASCKGNHPNHIVKITPLEKFVTRYSNYTIRRLF